MVSHNSSQYKHICFCACFTCVTTTIVQMSRLEAKVAAQQRDLQRVAPSIQQQVTELLGAMPPQADTQQLQHDMEAAVETAMQPYRSMVRGCHECAF